MTSSTFPGETGSRTVEDARPRAPRGSSTVGRRLGRQGRRCTSCSACSPCRSPSTSTRQASGSASDEASQIGAVAEVAEIGARRAGAVGARRRPGARTSRGGSCRVVLPAENSRQGVGSPAPGTSSAPSLYITLAWSALSFARHRRCRGSADSEDAKVERFTRDLMEMSAGRWLVGAIGVGRHRHRRLLRRQGVAGEVPRRARTWRRRSAQPRGDRHCSAGSAGSVAGIMMVLVGWFLIRAAVRFRPDEAKGIDGALREATGSTLGALLVGFAAVALVVYGLFCVVSAPRQRLAGAD